MDNGIKITKDKRHKSSSSLAGCLDGVRSERILDIRGSIPEIDDQFSLAETRCDDLQEKIDLVKTLKRKKKLKKRSMTTIAEPLSASGADNVPLITVRTQPKKKVSPQATRVRRIEMPQNTNTIRGYLDPDLIEQQQMLSRVNAYNVPQPQKDHRTRTNQVIAENRSVPRSRLHRARADGDSTATYGQGVRVTTKNVPEIACGDDEVSDRTEEDTGKPIYTKRHVESRQQSKQYSGSRRRHVPKEPITQTATHAYEASPQRWPEESQESQERWHTSPSPPNRQRQDSNTHENITGTNVKEVHGRPLVELFNNKNRPHSEHWPRHLNINLNGEMKNVKAHSPPPCQEETADVLQDVTSVNPRKQKTNRRLKHHSRRYELPTVSSQMKQAGQRYYYGNTNQTNIPFVVSKSTAPSHNVGVNIQQVLNGLKVQQPLSGIPLTIAHHMGLRHVPTYGARNAAVQPILHNSEINVIKVGRRMLRLPSYKYMSYNRLLALYREGDGIVPRFLRAVSRPHYFYTSMYNLPTNREEVDGATSKGRAGSQEAKQSLAEYANLYREYRRIEKCLNENYDPELELHKEELGRQLAEREDYIRTIVREYKPGEDVEPMLRSSASAADDGYRHSTFKLNSDALH